jgi:hypothetical protein
MPQFTFPKLSLTKITGIITTIGAIGGGILAFDARYNPSPLKTELESTKTQITETKTSVVNEMRSEVTVNRTALIAILLLFADDIEYQLYQYELNNEKPPRYMVDKHKRILRDIEKLQKTDEDNT